MARIRQPAASAKKKPAAVANRSHMGQEILRRLRERILNWHYPPGCHLGEQQLCVEFSASRIPVREALRALAEQGLVDKIPNQGCYVKQPDVEGLHHLYDVRLALELFVVERLARGELPHEAIASQRAYWSPLLHIRAADPVDGAELGRADENFHLSLARASGNPYLIEVLEDINERLRFVRMTDINTPHRVQATAGEHLAILDALEKNDPEGARRALRQNINHARNNVETAIARALMGAHKRREARAS